MCNNRCSEKISFTFLILSLKRLLWHPSAKGKRLGIRSKAGNACKSISLSLFDSCKAKTIDSLGYKCD